MFHKSKSFSLFIIFIAVLIIGCATAVAKPAPSASQTAPPEATYLPVVTKPGQPPSAVGSLGINLSGFTDWSTEYPLNDYFKSSRPWITQCNDGVDPGCNNIWDTEEYNLLDLDENGWVRSLPAPEEPPTYTFVSTILFTAEPHHKEGTFIVLYDGEGTITYGFGAVKDEAQSVNGRDVVNLSADGAFLLSITTTDPNGTGDYIRNIRVVEPERETDYQTNPFTPDFLAKLDGFRTLRFMDWMETNINTQKAWGDRPQMNQSTFANEEGVPAELIITLANQTSKGIWINMPHEADDDYFAQFAALVRDNLNPDLPIYVEFSNEVWNPQFVQHDYAEQQGTALFNSGDPFQDSLNWYGKRTAEMCDIWKTTFGSQSGRVTCVAGSQVNEWASEQLLGCPLWDGGPCANHGIDALAIAPYFGLYLGYPENEATLMQWTQQADGGLDSLFTELTTGGLLSGEETPANGALQESFSWITANKTVADNFGVDLAAYEGGQHLVGVGDVVNNEAITNLFVAANRDPRMGDLYAQYLAGWQARGGNLFAVYQLIGESSKWGSWGLLEYAAQTGSPKYDAVHTFTTTTPCWWAGCE